MGIYSVQDITNAWIEKAGQKRDTCGTMLHIIMSLTSQG